MAFFFSGAHLPPLNQPSDRSLCPVQEIDDNLSSRHLLTSRNLGSRNIGPKVYGDKVDLVDRHYRSVQSSARTLYLALLVMKLVDSPERVFPGWTGCNTLLQNDIPGMCNISYLPIIDASPTEYDTVFTVLEKSLEARERNIS